MGQEKIGLEINLNKYTIEKIAGEQIKDNEKALCLHGFYFYFLNKRMIVQCIILQNIRTVYGFLKGIPSYFFLFLKKIVHDPTKINYKLYYLIV